MYIIPFTCPFFFFSNNCFSKISKETLHLDTYADADVMQHFSNPVIATHERISIWAAFDFEDEECIGSIQKLVEANMTLSKKKKVKRQRSIIILAISVDRWFVQRLRPRAYLVLEKIIFKGTKYGHSGHHGQWTAAILVIVRSPVPRRLHKKFEQHWPRGFWGEVVWNSQHFPIQMYGAHTNAQGSKPRRKKAKCQCRIIILATLVNLPSAVIYAKIQPQSILGSGEYDFIYLFIYLFTCIYLSIYLFITIYEHGGHHGKWTATILAIYHSPVPIRLHMKFKQHWPRGFRGEVVKILNIFPVQMSGNPTNE